MERDHGPPAEGVAGFHTMRRTIVVKAAQSRAQVGQSALAKLCRVTGSDPAEIDEQIHALREALIPSEGHLGP